jgi:hypothetical protein
MVLNVETKCLAVLLCIRESWVLLLLLLLLLIFFFFC